MSVDFSKTLFGLDKAGGFKVWSVVADNGVITVTHGKEGGKMQDKVTWVKGKNIGKANETSPTEQARLEAISKAKKQEDKGYRENKADLVELPLLPMLAGDYLKIGHRIQYPCYASAKLDGVRCLAIRTIHGVDLKSRGGKLYSIPHIEDQLSRVMDIGEVWDGELYIHGKFLEEIVSAVKKPNELTPKLQYVVFDHITDAPFQERLTALHEIGSTLGGTPDIGVIEYILLTDENWMKHYHKEFVGLGYEGIMIRNFTGVYESGKRSADLQKYKEFFDEEFQITAVIEDKNANAVFVVFDPVANATFTVCYGDFEERKRQLCEPQAYIGKSLTVKYQTRYKDSRLPQFPTGVSIRDYE